MRTSIASIIKGLVLVSLLIFSTLTCLEARTIPGIYTGEKNMCHLLIRVDLCKSVSFGHGTAWCDDGWDHHCCFLEQRPSEGLFNCKESSKCHYECKCKIFKKNFYFFGNKIKNKHFRRERLKR